MNPSIAPIVSGNLTAIPTVYVANVVGGGADYQKVMVTVSGVSTNSCVINFYNPSSSAINVNAIFSFVAIGLNEFPGRCAITCAGTVRTCKFYIPMKYVFIVFSGNEHATLYRYSLFTF